MNLRTAECRSEKYFLIVVVCLIALLVSSPAYDLREYSQVGSEPSSRAKNIILMVPDGMGLSNVTAARIFKNGPNGESLYLETLPRIGYQRTHSANSSVTDSAAAASAWASGDKFRNGEISCHDDNLDGKCDKTSGPTILEMARERRKATGLVVTSTVTDATAAAFGAHVPSRKCEQEIARQYIQTTGVDVILGGGAAKFNSTEDDADQCGTHGNFIEDAENKGYEVVDTREAMDNAVARGVNKILGLFAPKEKTAELFRLDPRKRYPFTEPTLPQMTAAALEILQEDQDGFFLLVEGSQIDAANHDHNLTYQISETLAFDEAVKVVLGWINEEPTRKPNTLVIVAPDHETGGFTIKGSEKKSYLQGDLVKGAWTTKKHTAADVTIWSQGPGSQYLGRALDNTDLYRVMKDVLK